MHTYQGKTHSFHFNSDFSGEIRVMPNNDPEKELRIPAEEILKFVAYHYVLNNAISKLEQMDAKQLLSLLPGLLQTE